MASAPPAASMSGFQALSANVPTSTIELSISCRNIKDADVFSKSDPMCVLYIEEFGMNNWMELGRTECIMNTLNPDFVKKFVITYSFEEVQKLKFKLYDIDSTSTNLEDHDYLGEAGSTVGEIVSQGSITKPLQLYRRSYGTITVSAEELAACKEEAVFHFNGIDLDKKSFFLCWGSSSPFLTFSRSNENGTFTVVHRTEKIRNNINPTWKPFMITGVALCNGDFNRIIKVECHDYQSNGSHKFIGEFFTTLEQLKSGPCQRNCYELVNSMKQSRKPNYKNSGEIRLAHIEVREVYSFIDYLRGGVELLCTIAIDFTSSNGDPRSFASLHYMDPFLPNQYVQALRAVGEIIQDYDSDKLFPVLGFGARLPPEGKVSHEFFVNMNPTDPHCEGIEGIVNAYHTCLQQIQLYGPTNFAPVINHVARFAQTTRDGSKYHILLIITDGIITDLPQTKEAIVEASSLPLSIIIVGVGSADFSAMEVLDGDVIRLSYRGKYAIRDIVQFVPFRDFQEGLKGPQSYAVTQAKLARTVLAEIPDQFLSYMRMNKIKPSAAKPGNWQT